MASQAKIQIPVTSPSSSQARIKVLPQRHLIRFICL